MIKLLAVLLLTQANTGQSVAPTDAEVLRAMKPVARGVPIIYEEHRDDLVIVKSPLAVTRVPLFLPGGAVVDLDLTRWECTVHYTETRQSLYPFPVTTKKKRAQTVFVEKLAAGK